MTAKIYSTATQKQRERLLEWLRSSPISTLQARQELDIMHTAARVQELREQGHKIVTVTSCEDTNKTTHRVARYVLLSGDY